MAAPMTAKSTSCCASRADRGADIEHDRFRRAASARCAAIAGRSMPAIVRRQNFDIAISAPVLPAETATSASPFFTASMRAATSTTSSGPGAAPGSACRPSRPRRRCGRTAAAAFSAGCAAEQRRRSRPRRRTAGIRCPGWRSSDERGAGNDHRRPVVAAHGVERDTYLLGHPSTLGGASAAGRRPSALTSIGARQYSVGGVRRTPPAAGRCRPTCAGAAALRPSPPESTDRALPTAQNTLRSGQGPHKNGALSPLCARMLCYFWYLALLSAGRAQRHAAGRAPTGDQVAAAVVRDQMGGKVMRVQSSGGDFRVKAIAGTHTILMALDCKEARRHGLLGFAFKREVVGGGAKWLRSLKVFKSVVPVPNDPLNDPDKPQKRYSTREHPIQSFLWGDYTAQPDTEYKFTIVPMYGAPGALQPDAEYRIRRSAPKRSSIRVTASGSIAARSRARPSPTSSRTWARRTAQQSRPNSDVTMAVARPAGSLPRLHQRHAGRRRPARGGLRIHLQPVIDGAQGRARPRRRRAIVYHGTLGKTARTAPTRRRSKASDCRASTARRSLIRRTQDQDPAQQVHRAAEGQSEPVAVWTGSTNFTPSGFLGQTNVGHQHRRRGRSPSSSSNYWETRSEGPRARTPASPRTKLTPNPPALVGPKTRSRRCSRRAPRASCSTGMPIGSTTRPER